MQKDATPESEAAETMQGDTLHAAMEVGNLGTDAVRTAYRRGKILQSKRAAQHEPPTFDHAPLTDTTKPDADVAIPQLKSKKSMVSPAATRSKRKDLFRRKAFSEQAKTTAQVRAKATVAQEPDAVLPELRQPDVTYGTPTLWSKPFRQRNQVFWLIVAQPLHGSKQLFEFEGVVYFGIRKFLRCSTQIQKRCASCSNYAPYR